MYFKAKNNSPDPVPLKLILKTSGHLPADTQKIMKASKAGQKMIDSTDKA